MDAETLEGLLKVAGLGIGASVVMTGTLLGMGCALIKGMDFAYDLRNQYDAYRYANQAYSRGELTDKPRFSDFKSVTIRVPNSTDFFNNLREQEKEYREANQAYSRGELSDKPQFKLNYIQMPEDEEYNGDLVGVWKWMLKEATAI